MGTYVNPQDMTKEEWLRKNAKMVIRDDAINWNDFKEVFLICLIDNMIFSAAGIAFSAQERDAFLQIEGRPTEFYCATKEDLLKVSRLAEYLECL